MDRSAQAQHSTDAIASHPPISSQAGIVGELRDLAGLLADHQPDDPSEIAGQVTVAESPQMDRIVEQARRFAASSATVLITGESGTGKELIARIIHQHGPRRSFPYVRINCAAIPETLIESELFGHEK
ncbi:MAG: sigma 54-interacting transcriptional regulator, partial [Planctomycetales bacterium]|nr:sigma 54-interacting transcriptional regulator [Planctomycetales bacterium]